MNKGMEEWRDIPHYEGCHQASSLGRVRSLDRTVVTSNGRKRFFKGEAINGHINKGYRCTSLSKNGKSRTYRFSQIVAMAFLEHKPKGNTLVVDHINGDRLDDRVDNLRIVSHRANTSTCFRVDKDTFSSKYVGVSWNTKKKRWFSQIYYKGDAFFLGLFTNQLEASNAYQLALSKIKGGSFNPDDYKPKYTSKYKGIGFHKASKKWEAQIRINGKNKYIGLFKTEIEAHHAYLKAEKEQKSA